MGKNLMRELKALRTSSLAAQNLGSSNAEKHTNQAKSADGFGNFANKMFAALVIISAFTVILSFAGRQLGKNIALAGHSESKKVHEIVIGNAVLAVPQNYIRFADQRTSGIASQLELFALWPSLEGYSDRYKMQFNSQNDAKNLIFISLSEQNISRDMSARIGPIYRNLIDNSAPQIGPAGLTGFMFRKQTSVFADETLWLGPEPTISHSKQFVARCLKTENSLMEGTSLAPCQRDIHIGLDMTVRYRFSETLLPHWAKLDEAILAKIAQFDVEKFRQ